jgi:hypothetical protein
MTAELGYCFVELEHFWRKCPWGVDVVVGIEILQPLPFFESNEWFRLTEDLSLLF